MSSSTLVSEEWLLCRENASLSRELTDEVVDVEAFLRCCEGFEFDGVIGAGNWDCPKGTVGGWLSDVTTESRIITLLVPVGGDMSYASSNTAEADRTCALLGCPEFGTVG